VPDRCRDGRAPELVPEIASNSPVAIATPSNLLMVTVEPADSSARFGELFRV
jgi:hypothetical protein